MSWNDSKVTNDPAMRQIVKEQGFDGLPRVVDADEMARLIEQEGWQPLYRGIGADSRKQVTAYVDDFLKNDVDPYAGQGVYGNGTYATNVRSTAVEFAENKLGTGQGTGKWAEGEVMDMALHPKARTIEYDDLVEQMKARRGHYNVHEAKPGTINAQRLELSDEANSIAKRLFPDDVTTNPYTGRVNLGVSDPLGSVNRLPVDHPAYSHPDVVAALDKIKTFEDQVVMLHGDVGRYAASRGYDAITITRPNPSMTEALDDIYHVVLNRTAVAAVG